MKLKFDMSDFSRFIPHDAEQAADLANAKFSKWLSEQSVVYGWQAHMDELIWHPKLSCYDDKPTHKARVIAIEPLKSECEHEPTIIKHSGDYYAFSDGSVLCSKCNNRIKPTGWEAVK